MDSTSKVESIYLTIWNFCMNTHQNINFTKNYIDHFLNPRNIGEIENADGYARVGDPSCGDFIKVWINVKDEIVADYKYKVFPYS